MITMEKDGMARRHDAERLHPASQTGVRERNRENGPDKGF